ncbi:MAG: radical SAM family heme chaperone HemW [Planctomycetes bacterium]|nr:radical SAM family heme chaperone HemW [Planctomycetota bacterium]
MTAPSLYVHIPFCETKCPYCDFNSFAVLGRDVDGYLDALRREMDARGVPPDPPTVFIGGGTPTVVSPGQLARYMKDIVARLRPDPLREFTVEANPGSLTREKVAILKEHGVNRVSLGAQSLFAHHLKALGRVHDVADVADAYAIVREGGIPRVNLDFIYGVPGMTLAEWAATLETAISWRPDHLSCYALIFEPGTEFHARRSAGRLKPIAEDRELAMFRYTERRLSRAGIFRYEISNFARPGEECRHNLVYWRNQEYAGYGAGAFSYVGGRRTGNERNLARYADAVRARGDAISSEERLTGESAAREAIVLALRTAEGVDVGAVERRYGVDLGGLRGTIARMRGLGLVAPDGPLRLARRGWRVADEVAAAFL